jgi:hypothetical protein
MRYNESEIKRFNNRWVKSGDCYLWQGYLDKDGYGTFFFRKLNRRAHRVSYYMFVGDIPDGMVIDHICAKRNCVNPAHLRVLTPRENSLDSRGIGAQNARKTHCKYGHPFDRKYGKQRYCSICSNEKSKRLQAKWRSENTIKC